MITGKQYADKALLAYECKGGYIWGQSGATWTKAKQDSLRKKYEAAPLKYKNYELAVKYGEKWIGHRVWDCSGLTSWAGKQFGLEFSHGSNSSWKKDCQKKGKIKKGMKLPVGAWVYTGTESDKPHIGIVTADGIVTEALGTKTGVTQTKLSASKWKFWGLAKGIKFEFVPDGETEDEKKPAKKTYPTLKYGAKGDDVKTMQQLLSNAGSGLKVDGIFGIGTLSAVKSFQTKHNLVADGIVGPLTWEQLLKYEKK